MVIVNLITFRGKYILVISYEKIPLTSMLNSKNYDFSHVQFLSYWWS